MLFIVVQCFFVLKNGKVKPPFIDECGSYFLVVSIVKLWSEKSNVFII